MADTYLTDWYLEEWGKSAVARGFTHNSPKFDVKMTEKS